MIDFTQNENCNLSEHALNFKMNMHFLYQVIQVCCILLAQAIDAHSTESIMQLNPIEFVITNHIGPVVAVGPDTSANDLHSAIAGSYNIPFPFTLQLSGEIITSSRLSTNQSLREIPSVVSIARNLAEIWGSGFRIPLKLHRVVPPWEDYTDFASLALMFGGPTTNIHEFGWHRFVLQCLESRLCLIQDLCNQFGKFFQCQRGELSLIILHGERITGYVNVSATPRTVREIMIERNSLTKIIGLDQLAGKRLSSLDIRKNPLDIDFNQLMAASPGSDENPLKVIRVNIFQISRTLVGKPCAHGTDGSRGCQQLYAEVYQAATRWIESTTLDALVIGRRSRCIWRQGRT